MRNLKVLVIDDNEEIRKVMKRILESYGHTVISASDGENGLELFRKAPTKFDLIITDQGMPRILGEEIIKEVKSIDPGIKTILMTGDVNIISGAKATGADEMLPKPFGLKALEKIIQKFFG